MLPNGEVELLAPGEGSGAAKGQPPVPVAAERSSQCRRRIAHRPRWSSRLRQPWPRCTAGLGRATVEDRLSALGACRASVNAAEGRSVDLDGYDVTRTDVGMRYVDMASLDPRGSRCLGHVSGPRYVSQAQ